MLWLVAEFVRMQASSGFNLNAHEIHLLHNASRGDQAPRRLRVSGGHD
jgi:hypothetical protein